MKLKPEQLAAVLVGQEASLPHGLVNESEINDQVKEALGGGVSYNIQFRHRPDEGACYVSVVKTATPS